MRQLNYSWLSGASRARLEGLYYSSRRLMKWIYSSTIRLKILRKAPNGMHPWRSYLKLMGPIDMTASLINFLSSLVIFIAFFSRCISSLTSFSCYAAVQAMAFLTSASFSRSYSSIDFCVSANVAPYFMQMVSMIKVRSQRSLCPNQYSSMSSPTTT